MKVAVAEPDGPLLRILLRLNGWLTSSALYALPPLAVSSARKTARLLLHPSSQFDSVLVVLPGPLGAAGSAPFGIRLLRELLHSKPDEMKILVISLGSLRLLRDRYPSRALDPEVLASGGVAWLQPPPRLGELLAHLDSIA